MGMKRMTFLIDGAGGYREDLAAGEGQGHAEAVLAQVKGG